MSTQQLLWLADVPEAHLQLLECSQTDRECPGGQSSCSEKQYTAPYMTLYIHITSWWMDCVHVYDITCELTIWQNQRSETRFFYQSTSVCLCLPRGSLWPSDTPQRSLSPSQHQPSANLLCTAKCKEAPIGTFRRLN